MHRTPNGLLLHCRFTLGVVSAGPSCRNRTQQLEFLGQEGARPALLAVDRHVVAEWLAPGDRGGWMGQGAATAGVVAVGRDDSYPVSLLELHLCKLLRSPGPARYPRVSRRAFS